MKFKIIIKIIFTTLTILHLTHAFPSDMPTIIQKSTDEMSTSNDPITTIPSIMSTDVENSSVSTMDTKVSEMDKNSASNTISSYETTMAESNNIEKMSTVTIEIKISEINSPTMDKMVSTNAMTDSEGTGMSTNEMTTSMKDSTADMTNSMAQSTSNSMDNSLSSADVAMSMIATKSMITVSPDVDVMDTTNNLKREQLNEAEMTTIMESMGESKENPMTTEKLMEKSQEISQTEAQSESANVEKAEETTMKPLESSMMPTVSSEMTMKPVMTEEATKKNSMVEETTMMTETKTTMASTTEKPQKTGTAKPLTATMIPMETTTKMKNDGNLLKFSAFMMFSVSSILVIFVS